MIHVVLVGPEDARNVGSVARVMANFGFSHLHLVAPLCDHLSEDAFRLSKHAKKILLTAKVYPTFTALPAFDTFVGTSGRLGTDYNLSRSPLTPDQLGEQLGTSTRHIAILFGPESKGLPN